MKIERQSIPDIIKFDPIIYNDERGYFNEMARINSLDELGIPPFVQHNHARSVKGVMRGLHFQKENMQGKFITCIKGSIFDIAVDIRKNSQTFGKSVGIEINDINNSQIWIPPGFAHGYLVLSEEADITYMCTDYYNPKSEYGLNYKDKKLNIKWPQQIPSEIIISEKDKNLPNLNELNHKLLE